MKIKIQTRQGQSTLEFIILVTAVVAVVLFLTAGSSSLFQSKLTSTAQTTMTGMQVMASKLTAAIQSH